MSVASDNLGKRVLRDVLLLDSMSVIDLFRLRQGRGDLTTMQLLDHPASRLLKSLSITGAPVVLHSPPWTKDCIDAAVVRGPHKSAIDRADFLRQEFADMIDKGQWLVLPYSHVRHMQGLRVSPVGVIPQVARRDRTIVDYSFSGINDDTAPLTPREVMQFGRALDRILAQLLHADPSHGPVHLIKVDLSDGFYRVLVRARDIAKLGVAIPSLPGEEPLIAFPLALPMGWTESPPYFCMVTESITDDANLALHRHGIPLPHRLDTVADTLATTPTPCRWPDLDLERNPLLPGSRPLRAFDVFVDDFIGLAQGTPAQLTDTRRILFHAIDKVLRPLDAHDPPSRQEAVSLKKLLQGDGSWSTVKTILGWIVDTDAMTISLPERRRERLRELLDSITPTQHRLARKKWHKLLGELRSMALALPGSRGLFSALQAPGTRKENPQSASRLRLSPAFHHAIDDFRALATALDTRPTRIAEVVPTLPSVVGAHDASGLGAGGVLFSHPSATPRQVPVLTLSADGTPRHTVFSGSAPLVWRVPFLPPTRRRLITFENPTGSITNSDLELAGSVLHHEAAVLAWDLRERTIQAATDNMATLYWHRRGSISSTGPTARLLRLQALHQRQHRYVALKDYIPGPLNSMADDASRLTTLTDVALLHHFNSRYPQTQSWQLLTIPLPTVSAATLCLHNKSWPKESIAVAPPPVTPIGQLGSSSVPTSEWIPPSPMSLTPSPSCRFSPSGIARAPVAHPNCQSAPAPWKTPSAAWGKRSPVWGPRTRA